MPSQPKSTLRTRRQDKASQAYQNAKARKACVEAVWARADGCCEYCGRFVWRSSAFAPAVGHVHEALARSLGGDPANPQHAKLTCSECHMPNGAHRRSVRAI